MPTTQLPGFKDPVHEAQQTFRALLDALARPGMAQTTAAVTPPAGLTSGCAAACLTLLDLETVVWLQPEISAPAKSWLLFHTGCRFTEQPQSADFALISTIATIAPPPWISLIGAQRHILKPQPPYWCSYRPCRGHRL